MIPFYNTHPPSVGCGTYLRDAELTCGKFFLILLHFLIALRLGALQLLAALHHALYLRFHLADV